MTGYVFSIIAIILLPGIVSMAFSLLFIAGVIVFGYIAVKVDNRKVSTVILLLPVIMSALQNVYLGLGAERLTPVSVQVLLSLHFLLFSGMTFLLLKGVNREAQWALISVGILLFQSALLFMIYPAPFTSALSSIRNILSCMLIYCFGIAMYKRVDTRTYYTWIKRICWVVVAFGLFEWFSGLKVWETLNISRLWELKGIPLNEGGIPPNWYSSEHIRGNLIRRMVSTFADPVNLGTFLFAAFMIAWYRKERILTFFLAMCALFTVSKGSLLGFLVFLVIYVWQSKHFRVFLPVMAGVSLVAGLLFIQYSLTSSSGSIIAHARGFLSAFDVLATKPWGLGVGNVGVLAGLFNESLLNSSVAETGVGMIIAQLGVVGIGVYVFFFVRLSLLPKKWKMMDAIHDLRRERILYYTLLFAFIANALFNEVALSPNSCGLYFIELAFLNSNAEVRCDNIIPE